MGGGGRTKPRLYTPSLPSSVGSAAPSSGGNVTPAFGSKVDITSCDNAPTSGHINTDNIEPIRTQSVRSVGPMRAQSYPLFRLSWTEVNRGHLSVTSLLARFKGAVFPLVCTEIKDRWHHVLIHEATVQFIFHIGRTCLQQSAHAKTLS